MSKIGKVVSQIKEVVESEFNKMFYHKAYLQFYYDPIHRESVLKPIDRIPLVVCIDSLQQSFILRNPDHYLHGKPVYVLIDGYSLSITSEFLQTLEPSILKLVELERENISDTLLKVHKAIENNASKETVLHVKKLGKEALKQKQKQQLILLDKLNKKVDDHLEPLTETELRVKETLEKDLLKVNVKKLEKIKVGCKESLNMVIKTRILEKRNIELNSSYELYTWSKTAYNSILLKASQIEKTLLLLIIVFGFCIAFGTWIIADNYFEGYYREKYKEQKGYLIFDIFKILIKLVLLFCL